MVKGKVVVTDYLGWRKLVTHTRNGGTIALFNDLDIVQNMHVVDYKGEPLFFPSEQSFEIEPILNVVCYDCDGVPAFSHINQKRVNESRFKDYYEPLFTNVIVREFHKMNQWNKAKWVKLIN